MATSAAPSEFGASAALRNSIDTAPETAMIEPTERSMPPVAITRHMPTAIINIGAPARAMSMRLPDEVAGVRADRDAEVARVLERR